MLLVKFYGKDLNVTYWTLREDRGVVILRPTWRVALTRLLVTGFLWLISFGFAGVDYELDQMVEKRRIDPEQLEGMDQRIREDEAMYRKRGEIEQAEAVVRSGEAMKAKIIRERNAKIERTQALQRPWRVLLRSLAGGGFLLGLIAPLSVLWQRIRIEREGQFVSVRKIGLWTRLRQVGVEAAREPQVAVRKQTSTESSHRIVSYAWGVRLVDAERSIVIWVRATDDGVEVPEDVKRLVDGIKRVAS
jgi:hypothetical protein